MAFTKIAAAGIGSTGTVTLENLVVTGSITASLTGTATTTTNIPNLTGAITSNNTITSLGSFSSANLATALTDETGSGSNVFAISPVLVTPSLGIATATNLTSQSLVVSGISTLGTVVVGGGTTQLIVTGNARITGILTVGTGSITLDGSTNIINVGTGVTLSSSGINVTGIVTVTSIVVSAGTTSAPSISPSGDSNTGIFFPSADTISTSTGGTQRITIDSSGNINIDSNTVFVDAVSNNVGIGTTAPLAKLQINDSGDIRLQGSVPGKILFFSTSNGVSQNATLEVSNDGLTANTGVFKFSTRNTGGTLAERMSITASGVQINDSHDIRLQGSAPGKILFFSTGNGVSQNATLEVLNDGLTTNTGEFRFSTRNTGGTLAERMRISESGTVLFGTTVSTFSTKGIVLFNNGQSNHVVNGDCVQFLNRLTNDGNLLDFYQDSVSEGSISVSGTTISYNGAHLSRWSQLPTGAERTEILRGSVLSNIDEMCEWGNEDNEQLNRMKVSDVEGDKNVSGVFQAWDDDDDTYTNDFYCAMTGDFIIRIAEGTTVERGDLLMSAGDGTAKPQDDDIIRSKTIAKVTSTNISCTYEDGSYCVPCVLMAC